jgi:hypothetical protein
MAAIAKYGVGEYRRNKLYALRFMKVLEVVGNEHDMGG